MAAGFEVSFLEPAHAGDSLLATAAERTTRGRTGIYDVTLTRTSGGAPATIAELRGRSHGLGRPVITP